MDRDRPLNFSRQDLRNRSFMGQNLSGADFSKADLRGCNFRSACLRGATFDDAQVGVSRRQLIARMGAVIGIALVAKEGIFNLLFGVLGKTWESSEWSFILLLLCFLAGIGAMAQIALHPKYLLRAYPTWYILGLLNGALFGFYCGGAFFDKNSVNASIGGMVGVGVVALMLSINATHSLTRLGIATSSAIVTYGFAFYTGTWAIAGLSTGRWILAVGLGCIAILYLWFATYQIAQIVWMVGHLPGTFFRGADLTDASFKGVKLNLTDLPKHR